ncbi:DUF4333 domain-containing protein [Pseudonocardia sp. H11422]|uniref:DUF4333 domain-containing protein n=1 Tax=Pseudonocardia sp. H11422 TaxID=2835866 RepID=UPI001BDD5F89|nr:DUF4333 domain-containing protein [Pseudonocardia sp. H11422]
MRANVLAPGVLLAGSLVLAGCTVVVAGSPAPEISAASAAPGVLLDPVVVENDVRRALIRDPRISGVTGVTCPSGVPAIRHLTLFCSATIDGSTSTVPVTITTDDGGYEVGRPF